LGLEQGRVAVRHEVFDPVQLLTDLVEEYQKPRLRSNYLSNWTFSMRRSYCTRT